jgi:peroxiredoxin
MQVGDLHKFPKFIALGVELLSLSPDRPEEWRAAAADFKVSPDAILLSDQGNKVATAYDVMRWGVGEPGHTFILVDKNGRIAWVKDYGAPQNGGLMYVVPKEITKLLESQISN